MPLTTYTAGEVLTASSLNANFSFAALAGGLTPIVRHRLPLGRVLAQPTLMVRSLLRQPVPFR
jgi:hypothetical protein